MGFVYLVLLFCGFCVVLVLLCLVLVAALLLLFAPLVLLAHKGLPRLAKQSATTKNGWLLGTFLLWGSLWGVSYGASGSKWLTPEQQATALLVCACLSACYLVPLLLLVLLLQRNARSLLRFFFTQLPAGTGK